MEPDLEFRVDKVPLPALELCFLRQSLPLLEWHAEACQQTARLVVGAGRGHDRHFQPAKLVDLVVVDLREDDLLAQAERIVAAPVEALGVDATEVPDSRERDLAELVDV